MAGAEEEELLELRAAGAPEEGEDALGEERDAEARRRLPLEPVDDGVEQQVERRVERPQRVDLRLELLDERRLIDDRVVCRELVDDAREPVLRANERRLLRRHQPRDLRALDD